MPLVTALRTSGRDRVAVELDGEPWRTIPLEAALRAGVETGAELDRPRLRLLRRELRRGEAVGRAARALRARDRTVSELDDRLARAGVRAPERAAALATLERAGLVDDERVAASRASALAERGRGDAAIRWELDRVGVAAQLVEQAVSALLPERERAARVVAGARDPRKAAALLARRGFRPETIEAVVPEMVGVEEGGEVG